MIKSGFALILFCIFSVESFSQTGLNFMEEARYKIYYSLEFRQDTLDLDFVRHESMVLLVGETMSKFLSYGNYYMDSIALSNPEMNFALYRNLNPPRIIHHFQIFKFPGSVEMLTQDRVFADSFIYSESLNNVAWKLTSQTDYMFGYRVQKAIGKFAGRTWEAWFTSEVPVSDGPYKFQGLPGLIVSVSDSRDHYVFEFKSIVKLLPNQDKIFLRRSNYVRTSKMDFFNAVKRYRQDAMGVIISSGIPIHESTDLGRIQDNQRRRNNPIELIAD